MKLNLLLLSTTSIFCFASANIVNANEMPKIPNAGSVVKVTLILTPTNIQTRAPLSESDLARIGCTFLSTQALEKESILRILKTGVKDSEKARDFKLRNAIYIENSDGTRAKVLLSDAYYAKEEVQGEIQISSMTGIKPITAQKSFLTELREWASKNKNRKNFSSDCLIN
jgi:hypothetical protein